MLEGSRIHDTNTITSLRTAVNIPFTRLGM